MSESNYIYIVYRTTNLVNNKIYIGTHRQKFHFPIIFDGYFGSGKLIRQAIKKYGVESFVRETLHVFYTAKEAYKKEKEIVNEKFVNSKDTYNLCGGGNGASCHSPETKRKMSEAQTGEKHAMYGKKHSPETKQKMSLTRYGRETWNKGIPCSVETKQKISVSLTGKKQSEETKQKRSQSMKGKNVGKKHPPRSEEYCKKQSERIKGKKQPTTQCPHCGLIGSVSNLKRWHFDNCPHFSK